MIIFGLGNPGSEYVFSRHNLGFMVADSLALELGLGFRSHHQAVAAQGRYREKGFLLVKPLTYMNRSGEVVAEILEELQERDKDFLVVADDVDLDWGRLRLRLKGGTSGHKGLDSIRRHLGTEEFPRLRIGIGPRPPGWELSDYVLAELSGNEKDELPGIVKKAREAVLLCLDEGLEKAMNTVNPEDNPQ